MPIPVQSAAPGILGLLTSKFGGIGPSALSEVLEPTIELLPFYGTQVRQNVFRSQSAAQLDAATGWIAGGGAVTGGWFACQAIPLNLPTDIRVPNNEIWRVLNCTIQVDRQTGSGGALQAGWVHGEFPAASIWSLIGSASGTVGAGFRGTAGGECDFLAMPGSGPAFFAPQWDLGVLDFDLEMHVLTERYVL